MHRRTCIGLSSAQQQPKPGRKRRDAAPLRSGQAKPQSARRISAQEFHKKSYNGIGAEIEPRTRNAPGPVPAAEHGAETGEQAEVERGLQQLNREQAHAVRRDGTVPEGHGQRPVIAHAVAASGKKAAV